MTTVANGRRARVDMAAEPMTHGLAEALLAFHTEAPKLRKNADGQIQSRTYRYVTLDGVLDDVEPLLLAHGLLWTAKVTTEDGKPAALYRMTHVPTGEIDEWTGPLPCVDPGPQALGSAITYMRRYTLVAYLNLAPGDDDDGAGASTGRPPVDKYADTSQDKYADTSQDKYADTSQDTSQPTAAPPKPSERQITANQREKLLRPRAKQAGLTAGEFANVMLIAAGDPRREWSSEEHAAQTMERLLDRLPARLKDAVLDGIDAAQIAKTAGAGAR